MTLKGLRSGIFEDSLDLSLFEVFFFSHDKHMIMEGRAQK
jgi:hypothetical protein